MTRNALRRLSMIGGVFAVVLALSSAALPHKAAALAPGNGAPTAVYRWWNASDKDWVTIPAHGSQPSSSILGTTGYTQQTGAQYYVDMLKGNDPDMVAVYRWWNAADKDWIDIRQGSPTDTQMQSWGYDGPNGTRPPQFQYYAYASPGTGRVAINRWWHAGDKDWVTLRQDEIPDTTMSGWGYSQKTLIAYAYATKSPSGQMGYFNLGAPKASVVPTSMYPGTFPHTMSVLDVNPLLNPLINNGYRYMAYYGHQNCPPADQNGVAQSGIYIARSNTMDASTWQQDLIPPTFTGTQPCRWASATVDGSSINVVVSQIWNNDTGTPNNVITAQSSTDGLTGKQFGQPVTLLSQLGAQNGNPTVFKDPSTGTYYLYWFHHVWDGQYEIRVRSSSTFAGLAGSGPDDLGQLVVSSPEVVAAPQMMHHNGTYYLAVETHENGKCDQTTECRWKTRVLTSTSPTSGFYEIPGNPVYGDSAACVFQHVEGNTLHSYYCKEHAPYDYTNWTLDYVSADLANPN